MRQEVESAQEKRPEGGQKGLCSPALLSIGSLLAKRPAEAPNCPCPLEAGLLPRLCRLTPTPATQWTVARAEFFPASRWKFKENNVRLSRITAHSPPQMVASQKQTRNISEFGRTAQE